MMNTFWCDMYIWNDMSAMNSFERIQCVSISLEISICWLQPQFAWVSIWNERTMTWKPTGVGLSLGLGETYCFKKHNMIPDNSRNTYKFHVLFIRSEGKHFFEHICIWTYRKPPILFFQWTGKTGSFRFSPVCYVVSKWYRISIISPKNIIYKMSNLFPLSVIFVYNDTTMENKFA